MIFLELFYVFFLIGLFTFGGGYAMIPLVQSEAVSRGWITEIDFTQMISISEATPGPLAINMATFIGYNQGGLLGSIIATLAIILPSVVIILLIATILSKIIDKPIVKAILHVFQALVIGLLFATSFKFVYSNIIKDASELLNIYLRIGIFLICLITALIYKKITKKKINPLFIILIGAVVGLVSGIFILYL